MSEQADRFECIMEPWDTWMIWDTARELPARTEAVTLVGLRHKEAQCLCRLLNGSDGNAWPYDRPDYRCG